MAAMVATLDVLFPWLWRTLPLGNHLPLHWTKLLYLCMRLGNALYDDARQSLPHRYLNAAEATQLFPSYASVKKLVKMSNVCL